jgi:hypothetical protein
MSKNQKVLPINKYSIYELKAGIDKEIQHFLEDEDFEEIQTFSNIKIIFGLLTVTCIFFSCLLKILYFAYFCSEFGP